MSARVRMIVAWMLFGGWVAWLGWQSARHGRFPVVSRALLLNASWVAVAEVTAERDKPAQAEVTVTEVIWNRGPGPDLSLPAKITVANLPSADGVSQSGRYLLLLTGTQPYRLADYPRSPLIEPQKFRPRVYPDSPQVRAQLLAAVSGSS